MKIFIRYLKGLAVLFYHAIPVLVYCSSFYALYQACMHVNGTAALCLVYGIISLTISVILTFSHGARFFDVTFQSSKKKSAAADNDKKNF